MRRNGYSDEWHPGLPSYLFKNGKTSSEPKTTFLWWSQTCKQPNTRPKLWRTGSRHKLWATTTDVRETKITRMASTIHGGVQVRKTYLQLTWSYHLQQFLLPRILRQNVLQTQQDESTIYSFIFPKTELRSVQTHECCEGAMHKKS